MKTVAKTMIVLFAIIFSIPKPTVFAGPCPGVDVDEHRSDEHHSDDHIPDYKESQCPPVDKINDLQKRYLNGFDQHLKQAKYLYRGKSITDDEFAEGLNKLIKEYVPHLKRAALTNEIPPIEQTSKQDIESVGQFKGITQDRIAYAILYQTAQYLLSRSLTSDDKLWKELDRYFLRDSRVFGGISERASTKKLVPLMARFTKKIRSFQESQLNASEDSTLDLAKREKAREKARYASKLEKILPELFLRKYEMINYNAQRIKEDAAVAVERGEMLSWISGGAGLVGAYVFIAKSLGKAGAKLAPRLLAKLTGKTPGIRQIRVSSWAGRKAMTTLIGASGAAGGWSSYDTLGAYKMAAYMAQKKGTSYLCELRHYALEAAKRRPGIMLKGAIVGGAFGLGGSLPLYPFKSAISRYIGSRAVAGIISTSAGMVASMNLHGVYKSSAEIYLHMDKAKEALAKNDFKAYREHLAHAKKYAVTRSLHAQEGLLVGLLSMHLAKHSRALLKAGSAAMLSLYSSGVDTVPTAAIGATIIILNVVHGYSNDPSKTRPPEKGESRTPYQKKLLYLIGLAKGATFLANAFQDNPDIPDESKKLSIQRAKKAWSDLREHVKKTIDDEDIVEEIIGSIHEAALTYLTPVT